ncbi:aldehyde dehydrogenase family protein [Rugosimonospora acidiphila]|uniref:Aldehyde dehydrogenase family protein n=1 Tax=Rugosimonospora acidiphila TaxID=556531 RepID=A0ABP9SJG6_9ACTN
MYEVTGRINGKARESANRMPISDKFTDTVAGQLHIASEADIDEALSSASVARTEAPLTSHDRADILRKAARLLADHSDELAEQQRVEAGFTVADGRREVDRAIETMLLSADEAIRFGGESVPLGSAPNTKNRMGITIRKPIGVVAAITPFNSPVNTIAHKIGPALAAGNAVVLKPAEQTPSPGNVLADVLFEAGLPAQWMHVVHGPGETVGAALVADDRSDYIAFTGSTATGAAIHRSAGLRKTQLELGSISCTVVAQDAVIDKGMLANTANAAFRKAGQVCTSIQRIYVHRDVEQQFTEAFLATTGALHVGDPSDSKTTVGPLISSQATDRVEAWIKEAVASGAELLIGGTREGTVIQPTVLRGVKPGMKMHDLEAFGPVVCIYTYENDNEVIDEINSTPYGLASGVFTHNLDRALNLANRLDVGTLHVNGTSSSRVDIMPYGGLKASGHGIEGPAYAVKDMSLETLLSLEWTS